MKFFCNTNDITPIINKSFIAHESRVLAVLEIMLDEPEECYMNNVLNMHGVIKTVL